MQIIVTGFTTKAWDGFASPESRKIKDLTSELPHALRLLGHKVCNLKDMDVKDIEQGAITFVKMWDLNDEKYCAHRNVLLHKLWFCNLDRMYLISDHHDSRPAISSMTVYLSTQPLLERTYVVEKMLKAYFSGRFIENRFNIDKQRPGKSLDPSCWIMHDFDYTEIIPTSKVNRRWVHASLTYTLDTSTLDNKIPIMVVKDLKSNELAQVIRLNRLYIMPEHVNNDANWWRPNYLMGMMNYAACYASERDQLALFDCYFSLRYIEQHTDEVALWQSQKLSDIIQTKESFLHYLAFYISLLS